MKGPLDALKRRIDEHIPFQYKREPPEPVCCRRSEKCSGCPYPRHGVICWHRDGTCLRTDMKEIEGRRRRK